MMHFDSRNINLSRAVGYYDSEIARTPERALARLYDFMPGTRRPDFVDR